LNDVGGIILRIETFYNKHKQPTILALLIASSLILAFVLAASAGCDKLGNIPPVRD
jgi:hypothetical protein